jgi:hypothetical protein
MTKKLVRDLYTLWGKPDDAARWLDSLIDDCRVSAVPEVKGLGRVLKQWRDPILSCHTTGASNGPSERLNSIIKKLKRVATGFRRFDHYRTRILLAIGGVNWNLIGCVTMSCSSGHATDSRVCAIRVDCEHQPFYEDFDRHWAATNVSGRRDETAGSKDRFF